MLFLHCQDLLQHLVWNSLELLQPLLHNSMLPFLLLPIFLKVNPMDTLRQLLIHGVLRDRLVQDPMVQLLRQLLISHPLQHKLMVPPLPILSRLSNKPMVNHQHLLLLDTVLRLPTHLVHLMQELLPIHLGLLLSSHLLNNHQRNLHMVNQRLREGPWFRVVKTLPLLLPKLPLLDLRLQLVCLPVLHHRLEETPLEHHLLKQHHKPLQMPLLNHRRRIHLLLQLNLQQHHLPLIHLRLHQPSQRQNQHKIIPLC
mmetsp:Transcript_24513/g.60057  ORF Transcript_24513/g.60057 Transcript_24513/m.60057 type:complete len:255 (+) Transcript_24513:804-1568(+)